MEKFEEETSSLSEEDSECTSENNFDSDIQPLNDGDMEQSNTAHHTDAVVITGDLNINDNSTNGNTTNLDLSICTHNVGADGHVDTVSKEGVQTDLENLLHNLEITGNHLSQSHEVHESDFDKILSSLPSEELDYAGELMTVTSEACRLDVAADMANTQSAMKDMNVKAATSETTATSGCAQYEDSALSCVTDDLHDMSQGDLEGLDKVGQLGRTIGAEIDRMRISMTQKTDSETSQSGLLDKFSDDSLNLMFDNELVHQLEDLENKQKRLDTQLVQIYNQLVYLDEDSLAECPSIGHSVSADSIEVPSDKQSDSAYNDTHPSNSDSFEDDSLRIDEQSVSIDSLDDKHNMDHQDHTQMDEIDPDESLDPCSPAEVNDLFDKILHETEDMSSPDSQPSGDTGVVCLGDTDTNSLSPLNYGQSDIDQSAQHQSESTDTESFQEVNNGAKVDSKHLQEDQEDADILYPLPVFPSQHRDIYLENYANGLQWKPSSTGDSDEDDIQDYMESQSQTDLTRPMISTQLSNSLPAVNPLSEQHEDNYNAYNSTKQDVPDEPQQEKEANTTQLIDQTETVQLFESQKLTKSNPDLLDTLQEQTEDTVDSERASMTSENNEDETLPPNLRSWATLSQLSQSEYISSLRVQDLQPSGSLGSLSRSFPMSRSPQPGSLLRSRSEEFHSRTSAIKLLSAMTLREKMAQQAEGLEWSLLDVTGKRIFLPKTMLFLGREDCDVNIQSRCVDKRHAVLNYEALLKKFQIKDLGSINGTFVNDVRINEDEYVNLENMDSIRFGYDPMFYRMEKIEESPKMESLQAVELLSPAKDIPSWALRDTQPQPQGTTLQEAEKQKDNMGTLAECNMEKEGCIAEQGIRHTCGYQEDSDYGSQCSLSSAQHNSLSSAQHNSLSSAQHNGHAAVHTTVTTAPTRWEPITSPDFGEYTLTLATLGGQVHTTEDVSGGSSAAHPQNKTESEQSEQIGVSYQVVQEAIQPQSCPHSYPQSHVISPRSTTDSQNKEPHRTVANRGHVLSPEDGTISCTVINTSGAAVVRRQRPVTLTKSFNPPTVLSTIAPQSPISSNSGVRSYVYSEPPQAHTPKQGKVSTDRLSSHVLKGVHPTEAHTVAIPESYKQPVLPKLSPDSFPLDLSVSKHADFTAGLLNLSKGATNAHGLTAVQNPASSLVTLSQVVSTQSSLDSQGGYSIPISSKLLSDTRQSNTQPALLVYGQQPLASTGVVPGQEVRPPDPHVHLEKGFVPLSNTGPVTSTQAQDGVYMFQVQLPGTSSASGPASSTSTAVTSVTGPLASHSHAASLQQLQQLHQQHLQKKQLQLNQKETPLAQSSQFTSTTEILLSSPKETVPPSQPLQVQPTMPHQQQIYQQSQNQPLSQQQMQLLQQQQSQQQAQQLLQQYQNQQLLQQQLQMQQLQQQCHPSMQLQNSPQQLLQSQQLLQQQQHQLQLLQQQHTLQPHQLQQLQQLSQLQQFQPIQQQPQGQEQQLQSQQPQLQQQSVQPQPNNQETKTQNEPVSVQQNQETKPETVNGIKTEEKPSPSSSQGSSPQHKPSSNTSSPSKSHSRRDQRRSLTGQEKGALGTVFGATPLYGKPAWWGDDTEDKKEGGEKNGVERPDSLNLDQPPDMSKYKTDPKYAVTYMEIPGNDGSPEKPQKKENKTSPKNSPEVPPQPSMAFTIDMGETKTKGPRISMESGLSKFLPSKVRKTFQSRTVKKEDDKSDETSNSSAPGNALNKSQSQKSPGPRRKSGYHSDGHQSNVSSDNEDLSIRSDTVTTRIAGKKTTPNAGPPSTAKSTSGINRERTFTVMKHNKAPRDATRAVKSKTPTPRKAEKPPRDARQRSQTAVPMTSSGTMADGTNYLIEKMLSSQSGRPSVSTSKRAPMPDSSEYVLYREAKAYDAKIAALSEPLTPPPIIETLAVPKINKSKQEPTKSQTAKKGINHDGIQDNISEAGTYTIEADQSHSRDEETARKSIDKAFGLNDPVDSDDVMLTGDEEEEIKDEVADDGLMEGKLRRLAEEKKRTNPSTMTDSLEVEADRSHYQEEAEEVEFHPPDLTELSGDTPKWMRHWTTSPSGAKVTTRPAPPKFTPAAPANKDVNQSDGSDKPGTRRHRRKLPTPPIKSGGSTPSTPRSGIDLTSPRALAALSFRPVSFDGVFADDAHEDHSINESSLSKDSELFIPIPHDSDSEDSHRHAHNGYRGPQLKSVPKSSGLDSKKPPKPLGSRETTPRDKPLSSTPRDKVFKSLSSRTKRGQSLPHDMDDSMDLRSESEASIVSTSTDYSECQGSPRAKRKTAKSPISNLAKTNRAFALRRALLEKSESEPANTRSPRGSDNNLSRSTRNGSGGKGGVKLKSSASNRIDTNRPSSAQGQRSEYVSPALAKHARDNQVRAKSAGPGPMTRSDGGRFSLRTGKASPTPAAAKKTDTKTKSKSPAFGLRASPGIAKAKSDSRSNSPRTEEHNAWQRRKSYDPRQAVANAKAKSKGNKSDRSISVDSSELDLRSKSVPLLSQTSTISVSSEGEDFLLSEDRSYARASSGRLSDQAEIGRLSHELTRDLHQMARNIDADSLAADASLDSSQRSLLVSRSSRSAFTVCPPASSSSISALAHGGSSSSNSSSAAPKPQSPLRPMSPPLRRRVSSSLRTLGADDLGGSLSGINRSQSKELNTEQGYDAVVISSIYQLSLKVKTQTERLMERMQDEYRLSNSPSPTEDIASQSDAIPNQELAGILRNLRHAEQKLQRIDRGMFPQSSTCAATNGSPQNHQQYLRELERIRTEIVGFKPIDTPTAMPPSSRSRSQQWRTKKQDPFPEDEFY